MRGGLFSRTVGYSLKHFLEPLGYGRLGQGDCLFGAGRVSFTGLSRIYLYIYVCIHIHIFIIKIIDKVLYAYSHEDDIV